MEERKIAVVVSLRPCTTGMGGGGLRDVVLRLIQITVWTNETYEYYYSNSSSSSSFPLLLLLLTVIIIVNINNNIKNNIRAPAFGYFLARQIDSSSENSGLQQVSLL